MRLIEPTVCWLTPGTNVLMISLETFADEQLLTVRAYNLLKRSGVERVADLLNFTDREHILSLRNMTERVAREIARNLRAIGIADTPWDALLTEES